jgi:cation diffusion facilitator CzcD-associated flavoprotein CzcO
VRCPIRHRSKPFLEAMMRRIAIVGAGQSGTLLALGLLQHGPTHAEEESILQVYDGPHYPTQPEWYSDPADAR